MTRGGARREAGGGGPLERLVFGHRPAILALAAAATAALGALALERTRLDASLERTIPAGHPYVRVWRDHREALRGLGDGVQVAVERLDGPIWDGAYLEALRRASDALALAPGADRPRVRSLWMPGVRWTEVTEEGFEGGPVMPDGFDGSGASLEALRRNVRRAGLAGALVGDDERSSLVVVPLLDRDPLSGAPLDARPVAAAIEAVRGEVERAGPYRVHAVGFSVRTGALLDGLRDVGAGFAAAAAVIALVLLAATRSARGTALAVGCAAAGVAWQLGLLAALGRALDPFTLLAPFLVFAIGVSHGAQKLNAVLQEAGRGVPALAAARAAFRRLAPAGLAALLTDAAGFGALALVDVPALRELALAAALGVGALAITTLVLLPALLSYSGVSAAAAARSVPGAAGARDPLAVRLLSGLTARRPAAAALAAAAALVAGGALAGRGVTVGDRRPGAPELAPGSRYNRDQAYVTAHYARAGDRFAVLVRTPPDGCAAYETLVEADRLAWSLAQLPGVTGTATLADPVRRITAGSLEGNPRWLTLSRDARVLGYAAQQAVLQDPGSFDADCALTPVVARVSDRTGATLDRVVAAAEAFAASRSGPERSYLLAAGEAGLAAATHDEVRRAGLAMAACAWGAVVLLCALALRSGRAVLVTVIPLASTSVLCAALMAALGVGATVATLPVIALGVGIPDHALYLLSAQLAARRAGLPLAAAHRHALRTTGRAVALTGVTLAAGVVTWVFSPIRLQADMGLLLAFLFLGNAAAAFALVPALSAFLLDGPAPALAAAPAPGTTGREGA